VVQRFDRDLHSVPTRRSSDLNREALHTAFVHREAHRLHGEVVARIGGIEDPGDRLVEAFLVSLHLVRNSPALQSWFAASNAPIRSEEHTSELQSRENLVCRLL